MIGYVSRDFFKKRDALPKQLAGSETGKTYKLIFMRYPSKMICPTCATNYLKDKNNTESVIPGYILHEEKTCSDCRQLVKP